jgi:hypothetical protein
MFAVLLKAIVLALECFKMQVKRMDLAEMRRPLERADVCVLLYTQNNTDRSQDTGNVEVIAYGKCPNV